MIRRAAQTISALPVAPTPPPGRRAQAAQFLRYLAASLLALAADLCIFSMGMRLLGWPWWLAATAGFMAGATFAYFASIICVFRDRRLAPRRGIEFAGFVAIGAVGLALTQGILLVGISKLRLVPEHVRLTASIVTFLFNYLLRSILLFKRKHVA